MLHALLALMFFVVAPVSAGEDFPRFAVEWSTSCLTEAGSLHAVFKSASDDSTNGDMSVFVQIDTKPRLRVPIKPALFAAGKLKSDLPSVCEKTTGLTMASGHLLLLVQKDD